MNDAPATDPMQRYSDGYFTVSDGLRLHFRDYPGSADKPPLLCLPGLTRNARDFESFAERCSPRFRVLALEFRGRGMSDHDPVPSRYNPLTYAQDTIQLLDHLGIAQAVFVGTSLGGLVTMCMAVIAPQRIAASIINDIGPDLDPAGLDRIKSYVGADVRFADWDEAARRLAANNPGVPLHYTHDDWVKMARRTCRERDGGIGFDYDMAIAGAFDHSGGVPQFDMWPLFEALAQKPLLVIRGERSDLLSGETLERMKTVAPNMKTAIVAGVGHAPDLDEPEAVAAIDAFLAAV